LSNVHGPRQHLLTQGQHSLIAWGSHSC
jgi:hypothetical protein